MMPVDRVAVVHDYLTQRGGAERVVLAMLKAFPDAPLYTSLYEPELTFPEFKDIQVRTLPLNRVGLFRHHHRLALPLLATAFSRLRVEADVTICSSSGWAHGARTSGKKIAYCHTPAKWLYQPDLYLGAGHRMARAVLLALKPWLVRWDRRAAASADLYLVPSRAVQARVMERYGIEAQVLPAPSTLESGGPAAVVDGIAPGFALCVSRLLPYKNVDQLVLAFEGRSRRLVIVGDGPDRQRLRAIAGSNVSLLGSVSDEQLRWLYSACAYVIAPSHEDYGLIPVEAYKFGKPAAALRWGGFLDTVAEGETGLFFNVPTPAEIGQTIDLMERQTFDPSSLVTTSERYSSDAFVAALRSVTSSLAGSAL